LFVRDPAVQDHCQTLDRARAAMRRRRETYPWPIRNVYISMTKGLAAVAALALALAAAPLPAAPRQMIGGEQDHSLAAAGDCENFFATTFTSFGSHVQDQQQRELSLKGVGRILVTASREGAVSVRGWNRSTARLVVCRNAVANGSEEAKRLLEAVTVSSANGEISADGPAIDQSHVWWTNLILYVPRRASVEVRASNGGVAVRNMAGSVTAQTTNGGVSVAQSSGRYAIHTETGGITLDRVNGFVEAASRQGSIALKIAGGAVPTIEARTSEPGQIICSLGPCESGAAQWAGERTGLRIGSGVPDIRLATGAASIFLAHVSY
jgi:hypothetical protein